MWMTLLYIVAVTVVVVIVAIGVFYTVTLLVMACTVLFTAKAVKDLTDNASDRPEKERDVKRQIRISARRDKEEDRQIKRRRRLKFWNRLYRDNEGLE